MNRAIYAIVTSAIMLLGTFAMAIPYQEVEAAHTRVSVSISILKNDLGSGIEEKTVAACGENCNVDVDLTKRDFKKV